jgi:hypothetical protein
LDIAESEIDLPKRNGNYEVLSGLGIGPKTAEKIAWT